MMCFPSGVNAGPSSTPDPAGAWNRSSRPLPSALTFQMPWLAMNVSAVPSDDQLAMKCSSNALCGYGPAATFSFVPFWAAVTIDQDEQVDVQTACVNTIRPFAPGTTACAGELSAATPSIVSALTMSLRMTSFPPMPVAFASNGRAGRNSLETRLATVFTPCQQEHRADG